MSQTKKHCEPLVAVWLRPSTTEPCICCKQVAEKPHGEHLKNDVCMYVTLTSLPCLVMQARVERNSHPNLVLKLNGVSGQKHNME